MSYPTISPARARLLFFLSGLVVTPLASCSCEEGITTPPGNDAGATAPDAANVRRDGSIFGCTDDDGDGYGPGCPLGPDCNDQNVRLNISCDCSAPAPGCPCGSTQVGRSISCFRGLPSQVGVGACRAGTTTCEATGFYSDCVGEVRPGREVCDDDDDDCDGEIDEGVRSACNDCRSNCGATITPTVGFSRFNPTPENSEGVSLDPDGSLVLNASQQRSYFVWIANSGEGTVSKLDSRTGREVGRYATIRPDDPRIAGKNVPPWNEPCAFPSGSSLGSGNCGSRTAVDFAGDIWVANRAFGGQGSATKISNFPDSCEDRNGNGRVDTSRDVNGNGVIDVTRDPADGRLIVDPNVLLDPNAEFVGPHDECILVTVPIGPERSWPRALAIDAGEDIDPLGMGKNSGNAWVGAFNDPPDFGHGRYYKIDGATYAITATVTMPQGHNPYGAAINSQGILFSTALGTGDLVAIDTIGKRVLMLPGEDPSGLIVRPAGMCRAAYGIAIDGAGRVWQAGWSCDGAFRYAPTAAPGSRWTHVPAPGLGNGRGIAADTAGNVWMAHSTSPGRISRIDADTAQLVGTVTLTSTIPPQVGAGTIGAGIDFDGNIWGINHSTSSASKVETASCQFSMAGGTCVVKNFPVGTQPYTYSDFTGFALRNFTAPRGEYRVIVPGCASGDNATWESLSWTSVQPPGTSIEIRVKAINSPADIPTAMVYGPFRTTPASLLGAGVPPTKSLELTISLLTQDRSRSPVFAGYTVTFTCPDNL